MGKELIEIKKAIPRDGLLFVGAPGFEPGTPCSQSRCATGLRYAPKIACGCGCDRVGMNRQPLILFVDLLIHIPNQDFNLGACVYSLAVEAGFEPAVPLPVRQFSKLVDSATLPLHLGG